jgi:hypothetical protein
VEELKALMAWGDWDPEGAEEAATDAVLQTAPEYIREQREWHASPAGQAFGAWQSGRSQALMDRSITFADGTNATPVAVIGVGDWWEELAREAASYTGTLEDAERDHREMTLSDPPDGFQWPSDPYTETLIDWDSFWTTDFKARDWLVEPLLARGRSHAVVAGAKTGKSLLLLEVAAALACGRAVLGQAAGAPMSVLYVDHEMTPVDLWERLVALGYGPEDTSLLRANFHYTQLPASPPTDTKPGGDILVLATVRHRAHVVVLDTYSRAVEGAENDADTTRDYFRHTGRRLKSLGCTVVRLDHAGKDGSKGGRGSSAKNDDVDVVWSLTRTGGNLFHLEATHRRVGWVEDVMLSREEVDGVLMHRVVLAPGWEDRQQEDPVAAVNAALDAAGAPDDISNRQAREEYGIKGRNEDVAAALRTRKERSQTGP